MACCTTSGYYAQEFKTHKLNISDLLPLFNRTDKSIKTRHGNSVGNDTVSVFLNDSFEEEILGKL